MNSTRHIRILLAVVALVVVGVGLGSGTRAEDRRAESEAAELVLTLKGAMAPNQIISLMAYEQHPNTLSMGDHADHIHIGFPALRPLHSPATRRLW